MMMRMLRPIAAVLVMSVATPALPQGAEMPFAGLPSGVAQDVEVSADALSVDQASKTAVFEGNVQVGVGDLRLTAASVEVVYAEEAGKISALSASGGVLFSNGRETAEGDTAYYDLVSGQILIEGSVILTQGPSALSGDRLRIDLVAGTARVEGRVQTIFRTEGN